MNILKTLVIVIALSNLSFSQIDTTNWYPLQIGNKWHYSYGLTEVEYYSVEVTGDTIMQNGKTYYILDNDGNIKYQRNENNKYVFEYNRFDSTETVLYDFVSPDHTIWKSNFDGYYYGVVKTETDYCYITRTELTCKLFDFVQIDSSVTPPDTIFGAMIDVYPTQIKKGIGVTSYSYGSFFGLNGAIINGDTLGTLTSIKDSKTIQNDYKIYQNYPNPFNPTTTIEYTIPNVKTLHATSLQHVTLKIYDLLGREIATLVNKEQMPGKYSVEFGTESTALPSGISAKGGYASGVYFYRIQVGSSANSGQTYTAVRKMILLK